MSSTAVSDKENLPPEKRQRKEKEVKHLTPGQRVSGSVGEKIPNPDPKQRRQHRKRLFGNVLDECGSKRYRVQFDDGKVRECPANILRIERSSAFLPPDERPSPPAEPQQEQDINPDPDLAEAEDELGDALKEGDEEWEEAPMLDEEGGEQEGPRETTTTTDAPTANDPVTGGVWVGEDVGPNYHQRLSQARETISGLLGKTVVKDEWQWTVIPEHHVQDQKDPAALGVSGIELHRLERPTVFASLFLHLAFRDWNESLNKMNSKISQFNEGVPASQRVVLFSDHEFITGLALLIGASCYAEQGKFLICFLFHFIFLFF